MTEQTDWSRYELPQIWCMLAGEDRNASTSHVLAWQTKRDLLWDQMRRLQQYREDLAAAWPPERSEAAAKFFEKLDPFIISMGHSADAAGEIGSRLDEITLALSAAKHRIAELYRSYEPVSPSVMDVVLAVGTGGILGEDAKRARRNKQLTAEARRVMAATDQRVSEATANMPHLPMPAYHREVEESGLGARPLPIPPPNDPLPDFGASGGVPTLAGGTATTGVAPAGPVLAGGPSPISPINDGLRPVPDVVPGAPGRTGGPVDRNIPATLAPHVPATTERWMQRAASGQMALRPGGVIGGPPGQPMATPVRAGRPSPSTGPIGTPSVGGAGTHGSLPHVMPPMSGMPGQPGIRPSSAGPEYRGTGSEHRGASGVRPDPRGAPHIVGISGWPSSTPAQSGYRDPSMEDYVARRSGNRAPSSNDQWPVREGVSPVIKPAPEPVHDPGPGIIGLDR